MRGSIESELMMQTARNSSLGIPQTTIDSARNTARNPNGPVAATGSLHGIHRRNRLIDIDKTNRMIAHQLVKVKPVVSYTDQYYNGLK